MSRAEIVFGATNAAAARCWWNAARDGLCRGTRSSSNTCLVPMAPAPEWSAGADDDTIPQCSIRWDLGTLGHRDAGCLA